MENAEHALGVAGPGGSETDGMTILDIMRTNDLSQPAAELALANLQAKGLVSGFEPGNYSARIKVTAKADIYRTVAG